MSDKKIRYIESKEISKILSERTSLDVKTIDIIIGYWLRIILHNVNKNVFINANNFFEIFEIKNKIYIRFSNKAIRQIEQKGLHVK